MIIIRSQYSINSILEGLGVSFIEQKDNTYDINTSTTVSQLYHLEEHFSSKFERDKENNYIMNVQFMRHFKIKVDKILKDKYDVYHTDLPDFPIEYDFMAGLTPEQAVEDYVKKTLISLTD